MEVKMEFQPVIEKIVKKPTVLVIVPVLYFFLLMFLKWNINIPPAGLLFFFGAIVGMYILDVAEAFFHLTPSPFRTMLFMIGVFIVGFYTITSTQELAAIGLVLSLSLTLVLYQLSEWQIRKNLDSWYVMLFGRVSVFIQKLGLILSGFVLLLESVFFVIG